MRKWSTIMYKRVFFIVSIMFALAMPAAVAQDTTTIMTADDPEYGTYFTDTEGMALYIFLKDTPNSGESSCYDKCEENWPVFSAEEPLTLPDGVPGELGTITRTDNSTQVTYNGWPLYYFIKDKAAGDVTGQEVGDVWFLAIPTEGDAIPGAEVPQASPAASPMASPAAGGGIMTAEDMTLGTIFTDAKGMTLYIFLKDVPNSGESSCYDKCEENWPVFSAQGSLTLPEGVPGELGTITRTDGSTQVTYNGWPLYYWIKDAAPGDVTGQGVGDVWYVAVPTEGDAVPGADVPAGTPAS
jgi:predicted lipoprotein with Yx(FWY)xxD motif